MNRFQHFLLILTCTPFLSAFSQTDSSWGKKPTINFGGFVDAFYVFDFNGEGRIKRQPFLFNHNRNNEFNINLALLQVSVDHEKYRARIGLQSGTYPQDNYAGEDSEFKNIYEASVGVSLNKKNTLWLDAGIFPSNLGFESAISMDNMTLTRSLAAESSPYFLTGAKLTYNPSEKLALAALITNGWQRIGRLQGNNYPSFGTQAMYQASDKITINWSTFIGSEYPDQFRRMRYFNNFYGIFDLSEKWNAILGFDVGVEQCQKHSSQYKPWFVPTGILQYVHNEKWKFAARGEYIQDRSQVIIKQIIRQADGIWGASVNIDYAPTANVVCRLEARSLGNTDSVNKVLFLGSPYSTFFMSTSLAIKFGK